jgi:integrase
MERHSNRRVEKSLSAALVRTVQKPGKYHDGGGSGLYLRVAENGARQWVQRLVIGGRRRELGLGAPPAVSLAEARELALENKRIVRAGGDPLQSKRQARGIMTFEEAARTVHTMHSAAWRNPKHAAQFISTLETYAFPRMGSRKVSEITSADVLAVLQPIWLEKAETARRVRQRIGTVMKYAIAQGWRSDNPAENIGKALPRHNVEKQNRKALPYTEVSGCVAAVNASRAALSTKLALEFLILTACRSGEVRGARWEEVDIVEPRTATWSIPGSRTKTGKPHRVPLSPRAVAILREAEALKDGSGLVFPSPRGKVLSDMTLSKLVKELGFDADVHGFRTSFRMWAQEQTNYPWEVAEAALAHVVKNKAAAAYARSDLFDRRRQMMEDWAAMLSTNLHFAGSVS